MGAHIDPRSFASRGDSLSATDAEILAAVEDIGREGLCVEPSSALPVACLPKLLAACCVQAADPVSACSPPPVSGGPRSWRPASWRLDRSIRRPSCGPVPVERETQGHGSAICCDMEDESFETGGGRECVHPPASEARPVIPA